MCKRLLFLVSLVLLFAVGSLSGSAYAGGIVGAVQSGTANAANTWTATPQDVTALSEDGDWRLWDDTWGAPKYEKNTTQELIGDLKQIGTFSLYNSGNNQNFAWSDGVNPVSSTSTGTGIGSNTNIPNGTGYQVDVTLPSGTGNITLWVGTRASFGRLVILEGSTEVFSMNGGDRGTSWGIDRFDLEAVGFGRGTVLTIQWVMARSNGSGRAQFYGVAVGGTNALPTAYNPYPKNKASDVSIDVGKLTWTPYELAISHNVYFGTDFNDVNEATIANPMGTTVHQGLDVNMVSLSRLTYDTTYYWRVDEVNAPPSNTVFRSKVWKFATEKAGIALLPANFIHVTAINGVYPEQDPNSTCNRLGLDANDMHSTVLNTMWLGQGDAPGTVWIQYEFDKIYKFHDMLVWNYNGESPGEMFGAKDVNITFSQDGNNWTGMPTVTLNQATGDNKCVANTTVELNGNVGKFIRITFLTSYADMDVYGLSEVRISAEPTRAQNPSPANNATNQAINVALKWKPGRYAVQHYLYIGTDSNSVAANLVAPIIITDANYTSALDVNKKYYWKVDEVNMANAFTTWNGPVWALTTVQNLVIDGFEVGYGATEVNFIWATWQDGVSVPANGGSEIGKGIVPPGLSTVNHSGGHSMVVNYDNSGANALSQVSAQSVKLPIGRTNWTIGNPTALVVWFYGDPNNPVTDQLYLKLNSTKVVYDGYASDIQRTAWARWEVPLAGMDISNISSLSIGIEKTGATGGKGILYLDDIQLTTSTPAPVNPGTGGLIAKYDMENNLLDSSGSGYDAIKHGNLAYQAGKKGQALVFDGNTATYAELPIGNAISTLESCTISTWVRWAGSSQTWARVFDFGSGATDNMFFTPRASSTVMRFALKAFNGTEDQANASPRLSTNNWEHIACVVDAENKVLILYLNGVEVGRDTSLQYVPKNMGVTTQNYLGKSQYADPQFSGMMDDFRIYNKALSAGEVKYLYKN